MLQLPNVTLILLSNRDWEGAKKAVDKSCEGIDFGGIKIIWDEKITGIDEWNRKIVYDLHKYVDTTHALLIHQDGYVINPQLWNEDWHKLDFIGAPWPPPRDEYSYRDEYGNIQRVGNSVSLRSKKLMEYGAQYDWRPYFGNTNEDGWYCCHHRIALEMQGCKFATFEQALLFSKEHELPENVGLETFAFHSL